MHKFFSNEINSILSYTASLLFHVLIFLIAYYFANFQIKKAYTEAGYVNVYTIKTDNQTLNLEKKLKPTTDATKETDNNRTKQPNDYSISTGFFDNNADTTTLQQIYNESSLNVFIKYPLGWTFIDQNVDDKLDGVTFWANNLNINPPPYVHLEVCEKELFNPQKYKHNLKLHDAVVYFNNPENLANYYSQSFYFRTETSEDFNLKLTIKGEDAFKSFQPTFYGMLKSFRFGRTFF